MSEVSIYRVGYRQTCFSGARGRCVGTRCAAQEDQPAKLLPFFAVQPRCRVVLEACGGAHHWARELTKLGHDVQLIAPGYVRPFVKRQKNDAADAEAICEAAQRPSMWENSHLPFRC